MVGEGDFSVEAYKVDDLIVLIPINIINVSSSNFLCSVAFEFDYFSCYTSACVLKKNFIIPKHSLLKNS